MSNLRSKPRSNCFATPLRRPSIQQRHGYGRPIPGRRLASTCRALALDQAEFEAAFNALGLEHQQLFETKRRELVDNRAIRPCVKIEKHLAYHGSREMPEE